MQFRRVFKTRMRLCALCALALLIVALGEATVGPPGARASGVGPCSPLTTSDLAQPQVTSKGNATARLSRSQGTDGTLLTLTGSGWPVGAPLGLDIWVDLSGQFRGGPLNQNPITSTASGALPAFTFRLPSGLSSVCVNGMNLNGVQLDHVTILFVVHTLERDFRNARARVPLQFTYLASPRITSVGVTDMLLTNARAGASMPLKGAGWQPGERVTITDVIDTWPNVPEWAPGTQLSTPTGTGDSLEVTADAVGAFTVSYHLPDVIPTSTVSLWIRASDTRFGDIAFYALTSYAIIPAVYPSMRLTSATQVAGGAVTVTGDHWQPGQVGVIEYCRGQASEQSGALYCSRFVAEPIGAFQADSAGRFTTTVDLPANARLGAITVQARVAGANLQSAFDPQLFAQAQPLIIIPTFAEAHPRINCLLAVAPYLAASAVAALALLLALGAWIIRARRSQGDLGMTS